eukprot:945204-Ditylum_brightwellii.AAC.1
MMLIIYVPLLADRTVATINMHKKQLLQQEMYHHVLDFPKDHLIKERAETEDKDAVVIMAAEGVEEENLLGVLSQTLAEDCSGGCPLEYFKCERGRLG